MLSSCQHAFHLNHIIEVKGNFLPRCPKICSYFWQKLLRLLGGTHPQGNCQRIIIRAVWKADRIFLSLPNRGSVTPPFLRKQVRMIDCPPSVIFFSSTISVFGCRLPSFFPEHLSAAKLGWGRSVVMVQAACVDALQTQGTLPIMYAHHALVRTHPHRHSNTLARANKSTFLRYLCK